MKLVAAAKAEAEPERARIRAAWAERQVERMVGRGMPEDKARETLKCLATDGAKFDLYQDFILEFVNNDPISVGDVLRNPKQFDGKALADPFEGKEYGTTTAKFYCNTGRPCINWRNT